MDIGNGLMNMYFAYNTRVGDVQGLTKAAGEYEKIAASAETQEERKRYTDAAQEIKNELLPKIKEEMSRYANQLGLDTSEVGHVLTKEQLEEKEKTQKNAILEYLEDGTSKTMLGYKAGQFLSKDV